ncbi:hypothetical protein K493DRAFT_364902 [Basidiobolus meristosporus CBS 931.73]|uniref:DUF3291 domain-containing protein n=1 Tax=Basidiobolus meristosporus CBS 931.73 TaxID=1314790 RepID=A0A1Y1VT87_9FUNG|nr:hypothetical protein K493DRAFT_364902 [Basidiobolus meristosporus CBS 931.73]|eukprot:ORX64498.1 hypothetical protein K493DRAFT_364902 [Basidiobolus meristosporus CBS 931.73]
MVMEQQYQLAQLNVGNMLAPLEDPIMAGFVQQLDVINGVADASPGFVWRLQTEDGDATTIRIYENELILVNLSVWESKDDLFSFVYRSDHKHVLKQTPTVGHTPTPQEAKERLEYLAQHGDSPHAFSFRKSFPSSI